MKASFLSSRARLAILTIGLYAVCLCAASVGRATPIVATPQSSALPPGAASLEDGYDKFTDSVTIANLARIEHLLGPTPFASSVACFPDCGHDGAGDDNPLLALLNGSGAGLGGTKTSNSIMAAMMLTGNVDDPQTDKYALRPNPGRDFDMPPVEATITDHDFTQTLNDQPAGQTINSSSIYTFRAMETDRGRGNAAIEKTVDQCALGRESNCLVSVSSIPVVLQLALGLAVIIGLFLFSRS
jgi:hypothetical protein